MKLLKLLCLKWRRSRSRSKACASEITKLPPASGHLMTWSVAGSETISYTLVRNGATSGGFGTGPTGAGAFPAEVPAVAAGAAPEGGGDPFLDPIETHGNPSPVRGFEIEAASREETRSDRRGEGKTNEPGDFGLGSSGRL